MRSTAARLRFFLALLAWFAQLCLPAAHASMMATPRSEMPGWCGDPARALAVAAQLPAELREALDLDGAGVDHVAHCAVFCAMGMAPTLPTANTVILRAAGLEPAPPALPAPRSREQSPTPPSQGPPAHA